jgi:hypothetical protein
LGAAVRQRVQRRPLQPKLKAKANGQGNLVQAMMRMPPKA